MAEENQADTNQSETKKLYPGLHISEISLRGDYVTIVNDSLKEVDLTKLRLRSAVGGNQIFKFPENATLKPGGSTTVWSGPRSDKKANPPYSYFWTRRNIWNDKGDTAALETLDGEEIDVRHGDPEQKFHEGMFFEKLDLKNQYATLINTSIKEIDLSGWRVCATALHEIFTFPTSTSLLPGTTITLWCSSSNTRMRRKPAIAKVMHNPPNSFLVESFSFSSIGDALALYDKENNLRAQVASFPSTRDDKLMKKRTKSKDETELSSSYKRFKLAHNDDDDDNNENIEVTGDKKKKKSTEKKEPMSSQEFLSKANPLSIEIDGMKFKADPREFSRGTFGWGLGGKVYTINIEGYPVQAQITANLTVRHAKSSLPKSSTENGEKSTEPTPMEDDEVEVEKTPRKKRSSISTPNKTNKIKD